MSHLPASRTRRRCSCYCRCCCCPIRNDYGSTAIKDTSQKDTTKDDDHRGSVRWHVVQQEPLWLSWLFFFLYAYSCWIIGLNDISDINDMSMMYVEALLFVPTGPRHRHRHYHSPALWGVAVRGGADSDIQHIQGQQQQQQLPLDVPRGDDVATAVQAVRKACAVTVALQPLNAPDAAAMEMTKEDASPVTVADLAVQAVILHHLMKSNNTNDNSVMDDGFIAEEDSTLLRQSPALCQRVAEVAGLTTAQVLHAIDAGQSHRQWKNNNNNASASQQQQRPRRVWCLDPIDGTRGFLRGRWSGGQYAVALALLEDGVPVIGVLGCPNLPHNDNDEDDLTWSNEERRNEKKKTNSSSSCCAQRGCLFVASQGGGCYQLTVPSTPMAATGTHNTTMPATPPPRRLHVTSTGSIRNGRFCIGVESYSDAQGQTVSMARLLHGPDGVRADNYTIVQARRMDSQAKHGVLARGGAEWYVRLPRPGYVEWIWDHAAGFVVATEAGGTVTDTEGRPLDFSLGAQLSPDVKGVLMSCGGVWHDALVQAYAAVVQDKDAATTTAAANAATKPDGD